MMPAPAPPAPRLSSKVELYLSAAHLARKDLLSKSDPFAVVYVAVPRPAAPPGFGVAALQWVEVGRTEVARDNQSPKWEKQLVIDYYFEEAQPLLVRVFDHDSDGHHPVLGTAELPLARIVASRGGTLTLPLAGQPSVGGVPHTSGTLTLRATEINTGNNDELHFQARCAGLDAKDGVKIFGMSTGSSDPYIVFSRVLPDGGRQKVWSSDVIKANLNPVWGMKAVPLQVLCNGDVNAPLEVTLWDWDAGSAHDLIGSATTTVAQLLTLPQTRGALTLTNPKKVGRSGYKGSGTLTLERATLVRVPSLLDYIRGGTQINLVVAVDYTGSNGDPRQPNSLHFINPSGAPNEYLSALMAVGSILLEYDSDKQAPIYGFGGEINSQTRHCFALTFNDAQPEVPGIEGLVHAYKNSFNYVGLSGPTYLAPVIQTAAQLAAADAAAERLKYTVLLLLTDGQANDLEAAVASIVSASTSPLSIVIVGVGGADFSAMEFLDGDGKALSAGGRTAARDIVQFVPFRRFAAGGPLAGSQLAAATLAELPGQLVKYFTSRGIMPPPPLQPAAVPVPLPAPGAVPVPLATTAHV